MEVNESDIPFQGFINLEKIRNKKDGIWLNAKCIRWHETLE